MDMRYKNIYGRILSWQVLLVAVVVAAYAGGLHADDSFMANTPQQAGVSSSTQDSKSVKPSPHGLSGQSPSNDEEISSKKITPSDIQKNKKSNTAPVLSQESNIGSGVVLDQWENRTLARANRPVASGGSSQSTKEKESSNNISVWRSMGSLIVVLALIVGISFIFKRFVPSANRFSKDSGLEVLVRCGVGPKQSLCLVKMGPRLVLIGLSPNHMASLDVVTDDEDVAAILGRVETASPDSITNSFGKYFRQESGQFTESPNEPSEPYEKDDLAEVRQIHLARRELSSLLDKVKGLARLKDRF